MPNAIRRAICISVFLQVFISLAKNTSLKLNITHRKNLEEIPSASGIERIGDVFYIIGDSPALKRFRGTKVYQNKAVLWKFRAGCCCILMGDNKLAVTLKDYVDWIMYSKELTEEDIGREIHKKMDLTDVYYSFSQTR